MNRGLLLSLVVLFVVGTIGFLLWKRTPDPHPVEPSFTAAEITKLQQQKNEALGLLENGKLMEAAAQLETLAKRLPREPLVIRNLAICQLLMFETAKIDAEESAQRDELLTAVQETLKTLRDLEPQSPISAWLSSRAEKKRADSVVDFNDKAQHYAAAFRELNGVNVANRDTALWYELFSVAQLAGLFDGSVAETGETENAMLRTAFTSLRKVRELEPKNLSVLREWLQLQLAARRLPETIREAALGSELRDEELLETIAAVRSAFAPLAAGIQRRLGEQISVSTLCDQIEAAIRTKNWPTATGRQLTLNNIIAAEDSVKSDLRRLPPYPLAYMSHDFVSVKTSSDNALAPLSPTKVTYSTANVTGDLAAVTDVWDVRLIDFDLDGQRDLVLLREEALEVWGRKGESDSWELLTRAVVPAGLRRMFAADLDRDTLANVKAADLSQEGVGQKQSEEASAAYYEADPDFVLFGAGGVLVLRNEWNKMTDQRTLEPVVQPADLSPTGSVRAAELTDFDHDGDLDIVFANELGIRLWSNRGNETFDDTSKFSELPPGEIEPEAFFAVDWDRDVDVDLLLADPNSGTLGLLENLRHGEFRWRQLDETFGDVAGAVSLLIVESDGNVSWDLLSAGQKGVQLLQTTMPAAGSVKPLRTVSLTKQAVTWQVAGDFNNDGRPDLIAGDGSSVGLYLNANGQQFLLMDGAFADPPNEIRNCEAVDFNGDGVLDLLFATSQGLKILNGVSAAQNHWLDLQVKGIDEDKSGRVNHHGLGSVIEVKVGEEYQAQIVTRPLTHFGLGNNDHADVARIMFPNGVPQAVIHPATNQIVREKQQLIGSCPYLYTWTGERFEFFTDLLWAAPLGLQVADGVLMPDRPWEFLKIEGDRLRAKDGRYSLRVTEELWEAGYFDQIELLAVDHPADVEVFSNEKVGPAEIAEFKIHTVRERHTPRAARDQQGRDLLAKLQHRDNDFAQAFDRTLLQGLAEDHFIELDLGRFEPSQKLMLYLTGWIYPTDTSLNIALSQDPDRDFPHAPSLWVPNTAETELSKDDVQQLASSRGLWRQAKPFIGFPGGKTKTIAIDLSGVFSSTDCRVRIATNAEIRWDEAFFTVDEAPAETRVTPLSLVGAELRFRGCSLPIPHPHSVPETYDYAQVTPQPIWPPMGGRFTRYGDVRELLLQTDDRLVVLGAGDEIALDFTAIPAPPAGWRRDFVLHNVGWDKDCVLNTVYGQTVEPLPFQGMKRYPYFDATFPNTPQHQDYLRRYQTREQPPATYWRQIKMFGGN